MTVAGAPAAPVVKEPPVFWETVSVCPTVPENFAVRTAVVATAVPAEADTSVLRVVVCMKPAETGYA